MARPPCRSERGQATLEWTALVAVVALVLSVAGAAAGAPGITNAVGGALQRALCLVGGGTCRPPERKACVLSSSDYSGRAEAKLTWVKIGGRLGLLQEVRSDGTVRLSLVDGVEIGGTAGTGARVRAELDGLLSARAGGMAEVEIVARLGHRRTWHVRSEREAEQLSRRIVRHVGEQVVRGPSFARPVTDALADVADYDFTELPEPVEQTVTKELQAGVTGSLALLPGARAGLKTAIGMTKDSSGGRTYVLSLEGSASLDLKRALLGLKAEGSTSVAASLSFDRRGNPTELEVSSVAAGDAELAPSEDVAYGQGVGVKGAGRVEAKGTLDLTSPEHRAAAERLMAALTPGGARDLPAAVGDLARRLERAGTLSRERHATSRDAYTGGGTVGMGPQVGLEVEGSKTTSRLVDAWWRPPGGAWEPRLDCLGDRA